MSDGRRFLLAGAAGAAFALVVMENIDLTHPGALERHHTGGQIVMVIAAMVFGWIVGWGCGR